MNSYQIDYIYISHYKTNKMRRLFVILSIICSVSFLHAQPLEGSWKLISLNHENAIDREVIKIVVDGYFALGSKRIDDNSFLGAAGGVYKLNGDTLIEKRDFDTYDESKINRVKRYNLTWIDANTIEIADHEHIKVWKRLSGSDDQLSGNWVITGRQRNGEMYTMTPGDRRTLKILNGDRFQWVAFNSATKTFMASGGGSYSAKDGVYTEHISFFSKDKSRAGDELEFKFEVMAGKWYHKGQSTKGQSIFEIWSPYSLAYPTAFTSLN